MATLARWEPFREMRRVHDMLDRLMDDAYTGADRFSGLYEGLAPVDVYQTEDSVVVKAILPGVQPDDIQISITGDTLQIRGEVQSTVESNGGSSESREYYLREHRFSRFSRSLTLPTLINAEKADASFENGVLTLTLPKAEEVKPKTITVKAK